VFTHDDREGMSETPPAEPRRRPEIAFIAFLTASIAAHATVFGWLPVLTRGTAPAPPAALQVAILDPLPLVERPMEPVSQTRPSNRADPLRAPSATDRKQAAIPPQQALAVSEPRPDERYSAAAGAEVAEPAAAAIPSESSQTAAISAAPPAFHAAYLSNPAPRYPDAARRSGEQGTVTLRVQVARDGVASRVSVEQSSGSPHLDAAALEAVKAWRFAPARRGVEAIESWLLVPIVFRLENPS
jgi:protein TonB